MSTNGYFCRVRSLLEPLFLKLQVFTTSRIDNTFTKKELGNMFLKIPELLNDVIFQNSFEWLLFKNTPGNKNMFKVDDKKSTSATSVIVIRVPLSLA